MFEVVGNTVGNTAKIINSFCLLLLLFPYFTCYRILEHFYLIGVFFPNRQMY